jgi:hypothetical protein
MLDGRDITRTVLIVDGGNSIQADKARSAGSR